MCPGSVSAIKTFTSSKFLRIKLFLLDRLHHLVCDRSSGWGEHGEAVWTSSNIGLRLRWSLCLPDQLLNCRTECETPRVSIVRCELMDVFIKRDCGSHC